MDRSGSGEAVARMLEAAERLAEAMAAKAAPRVSEAHRGFPDGIRYGLDRTSRTQEQAAAEFDRLGGDDATRAEATELWLDRMPPSASSVDGGPVLGMYRTMEDWRGITMTTETVPRFLSEDPNRLEHWVDWYDTRISRNPEPWPDIPKDELRTILRGWAE